MGKDAPRFAEDVGEQPFGEWVVAFQQDEVGGDFFHVGLEFSGVEAAVFGLELDEVVDEFFARSTVEYCVSGFTIFGEERLF